MIKVQRAELWYPVSGPQLLQSKMHVHLDFLLALASHSDVGKHFVPGDWIYTIRAFDSCLVSLLSLAFRWLVPDLGPIGQAMDY